MHIWITSFKRLRIRMSNYDIYTDADMDTDGLKMLLENTSYSQMSATFATKYVIYEYVMVMFYDEFQPHELCV